MPVPYQVETDPSYNSNLPGGNNQNSDCGPWEYNGRRYINYERDQIAAPHNTYGVFASTADGTVPNSFTVHDFANSPGPKFKEMFCHKPDAENVIYFAVSEVPSTTNLRIGSFDMTTQSFGSYTAHLVINGGSKMKGFRKLSDGSFVVFFDCTTTGGGPFNGLGFVRYSGSWGSFVLLAASDGLVLDGLTALAVDSSDTVWSTVFLSTALPAYEVRYISLTLTDIVTSTLLFSGTGFNTHCRTFSGGGFYITSADQINLPTFNFVNSPPPWTTEYSNVVIDAPGGAATQSLQNIGSPIAPDTDFNWWVTFAWQSSDAATNYAAVLDFLQSRPNQAPIMSLWQKAASATSWTGPSVLWDWNVDPPVPFDPGVGPDAGWPFSARSILGDTQFGVILAPTVTTGGSAVYYFETGAAVAPLLAEYMRRRGLGSAR